MSGEGIRHRHRSGGPDDEDDAVDAKREAAFHGQAMAEVSPNGCDSEDDNVDASNQQGRETAPFSSFFQQKRHPFSWWRVARSFLILIPAVAAGIVVNPRFAVISPATYYPPLPPPREGVLSPNERLLTARQFAAGRLPRATDFVIDKQNGSLLYGSLDGWIRRIKSDATVEVYAKVGFPVLGLAWCTEHKLVVCAGNQGLLAVHEGGEVEVITRGVDGTSFSMVNSAAVARDGSIYFSDGSDAFTYSQLHLEGLEMGLRGRLLVHLPASGTTQVLVKHIALAAGVALSPKEDFVLLADVFRYRIVRYWLKGPKEGTGDFLLENLPGYPSGVSYSSDGTLWIALHARRSTNLDFLQQLPLVKTAFSHFPASWWWQPDRGAWILQVNGEGTIVESYEDSKGRLFNGVTAVQKHLDQLYFTGPAMDAIGVLDLDSQ